MTIKFFIASTVVASFVAVTAFAHGKATGIVKERMDGMSIMGKAMKTLTPMMRGEVAFDGAVVREMGERIGAHAGTAMTKRFPAGSGGKPSEAKDAVWENWEEFSALAEQLHGYSEGLALASYNGLMVPGSAPADTGAMMGTGSAMMGGSAPMMDGTLGLEALSEMPADGVFALVSQTCSACHTKFRAEAK